MPQKTAKASKASKSVAQHSKSHTKSHKRSASVASINEPRDDSPSNDVTHLSPQKRRRHSQRTSTVGNAHSSENPASDAVVDDQSRCGRMSEPRVVIETTPLSSIQVDRRRTLSPGLLSSVKQNGNEIQVQFSPLKGMYGPDARTRRRLARNHISEEMNAIEEHTKADSKLKQDMRELRQQLELQDKEIAQLKLDHEVERLSSIGSCEPEHAEPMRQKADSLRQQLEDLKEAHPHIDIDAEDVPNADDVRSEVDDMDYENDLAAEGMDFDEVEDYEVEDENNMETLVGSDPPQMESTKARGTRTTQSTTKTVLKTSTVNADVHVRKKLLDPMREVELKEYEDRITELYQASAEKEARLENLMIQLRALGFSHGDPEEVEVAIRSAFRDARSTFNDVFPDDNTINLENGEFLAAIVQRLENSEAQNHRFTTRVKQTMAEIEALTASNDNLVAKYQDLEARKKALEKKWHDADIDAEQKSKEILELEDSNEALEELLADRDADSQAKDEAIEKLKSEIEGHEQTIARHIEVQSRLFEERKKLDQDFLQLQNMLNDMCQKFEISEQHFKVEKEKRQAVECEADEKQTTITHLERHLEHAMENREKLQSEVASLSTQNRSTRDQLSATSEELNDQKNLTDTLEERVADANDKIQDLETNLHELRQQLSTQQKQREVAEADVESRDETIVSLGDKLSAVGKEAQDLRNKLWAKQNQVEESIRNATEREAQYQNDMEVEIERRETAEAHSTDLETTIETLHQSIVDITVAKGALESEMNEIMTAQASRIDTLETDLNASRDQHTILSEESKVQIATLEGQVQALDRTISTYEASIDSLQTNVELAETAHQQEIDQKDADITQLHTVLDAAKDANAALRRENNVLAMDLDKSEKELNDFQALHTKEAIQWREDLELQEEKFEQLSRTASAKNEQIQSLTNTNTILQEKNSALIEKLRAAKAAYLDQSNEANSTIEAQEREMRNAVSRFESRKTTYQEQASAQRAVDMKLFDTDDVYVTYLATPSSTQDLHIKTFSDEEVPAVKSKNMKKSKKMKSLKSRSAYRDSGFGAASSEIDEVNDVGVTAV